MTNPTYEYKPDVLPTDHPLLHDFIIKMRCLHCLALFDEIIPAKTIANYIMSYHINTKDDLLRLLIHQQKIRQFHTCQNGSKGVGYLAGVE